MLLQDRLNLFGLDKLIESSAPPSPGGVERKEDVLVLSSRLGPGFSEDSVGAWSRFGQRLHRDEDQTHRDQKGGRFHSRSITPDGSSDKC